MNRMSPDSKSGKNAPVDLLDLVLDQPRQSPHSPLERRTGEGLDSRELRRRAVLRQVSAEGRGRQDRRSSGSDLHDPLRLEMPDQAVVDMGIDSHEGAIDEKEALRSGRFMRREGLPELLQIRREHLVHEMQRTLIIHRDSHQL